MEITDVSAIIWISATINIALGAFVCSASKKRSSAYFFAAVMSAALWALVIGFYISVRSVEAATVLVKTAYFAGLLVVIVFSYFFFIYPDSKRPYLVPKILSL